MSAAPTLRPYQHAASEAIAVAFKQGQNRLLVKKPTGTGKTVWFASLISFLERRFAPFQTGSQSRGARMLVIAHREELLDQAADKIRRQNPKLVVDIEQGDRRANRYSDVVIASIQTLAAQKFRRLLRLLDHHDFRLVVVDEAHHAAAPSYRTALVHLGFLPTGEASDQENVEAPMYDDVVEMEKALKGWDAVAPKDRLLIGVTATPNRSDAIGLNCVFQSIAYSYGLKQAIEDRWLVPITPWVVESDVSLDDVRVTAGEFNQKDLAAAVNNDRRNKLGLAAWQEHAEGRSTIAFTVDVAHAHQVAETFRVAGIRAEAISGETPKDERRQLLADYTAGKIQVLSNCMVLTEGTDLPRTGCILHLKPTKSATLYEQMTGRGLRLFDGKSDCVVIDVVDLARRHSLQTAPVLAGLPPGLKTKGESLKQLEDELEALKQQYPTVDLEQLLKDGRLTLAQLKARASTFDVWQIPDLGDLKGFVTMNWIRIGTSEYRVSYPWQTDHEEGNETLVVMPDMLGHFEVSCTFQPKPAPGAPWSSVARRQRTLAQNLPTAAIALTFAETYVQNERRQAMRLKDRDAPWRTRPASDKQLAVLDRRRIPYNRKTLTMGQASDLIDMANARRGR